ncbi:MAG: DUF3467 domain-containing protein [Nitrospira sp.]|nr:DUF3467 domain-containing protein [Candidatus Manganitrophaceae bacterium]HIL35286.1 DUF3467 domain-containing protein [Candidatus Manganitrophaceae bacterium]
MSTPEQQVQIQIEIDDATSQGIYANMALLAHTETEFVIDFVYIQPQTPKAKVRARILSSPAHTKRLLMALQDNIRRFEDKFGEIKAPSTPEKDKPQYQGHYL